ncbi:MAG: hypothetical protein H7Z12_12050 [Rhodospirillaceae bacterium]|nr:hypothetical protein [Rhodospirillales bacterium]
MNFDVQIRSASALLGRSLAPIEQVFLDAGTHLASAVDILRGLTDGFSAIAHRMSDDDSVVAFASLETISGQLGRLGEGTQASQTRLETMQAEVSALEVRIQRLRKVIGEIRLLAINAKVEAAHITARDVDFTVFTQEIGRLASMADEGLGLLAGELAGLVASLGSARDGLTTFGRDYGRSLGAVSDRLSSGLKAVAQRRKDSADTILAVGDLSRHMAGQVAQAVEALQVGDITRQRAEHVREALATLLDILNDASLAVTQDGAQLSPAQRIVLTGAVCRLQAAQATQGGEELGRELKRMDGNLHELAADIASLPNRCNAVYGSGSGSSFLAELGHEFEEAHQLLRRYAEARAGVEEVVSSISTVVAGMVRHVEAIGGIEADMRVMGLNATFKCARLGTQGRSLSVIAQELRGYSNRTAEDGSAIMAGLQLLIASAGAMRDGERLGHQAADLEGEMAASVHTLESIGDELGHSLATLATGSGTATQALERSVALLRAHPEFVNSLVECGTMLTALAGDADDKAGDLDSIRDEVLHLLHGRYTMDSERRVHHMLGGTAEESPAPAATEADVDDLLF